MKTIASVVSALTLGAFLAPQPSLAQPPAQAKQSLSPEAIYAKCKPSVVTILTFDANRAPLGQGSGFIVARNRVVTNYHVLAGSSSASIIFSDGSMATVTTAVAASAPEDLMVVEVETGNRAPLTLGDELLKSRPVLAEVRS